MIAAIYARKSTKQNGVSDQTEPKCELPPKLIEARHSGDGQREPLKRLTKHLASAHKELIKMLAEISVHQYLEQEDHSPLPSTY